MISLRHMFDLITKILQIIQIPFGSICRKSSKIKVPSCCNFHCADVMKHKKATKSLKVLNSCPSFLITACFLIFNHLYAKIYYCLSIHKIHFHFRNTFMQINFFNHALHSFEGTGNNNNFILCRNRNL